MGHDIKYSLGLLGRYLPGADVAPLDDTMLLSFVLDAGTPLRVRPGRPSLGSRSGRVDSRQCRHPPRAHRHRLLRWGRGV